MLSATAEGLVVGFQQVPEAKSGKNRLHLDLVVEHQDARPPRSRAWAGGGWSPATHAGWRAVRSGVAGTAWHDALQATFPLSVAL